MSNIQYENFIIALSLQFQHMLKFPQDFIVLEPEISRFEGEGKHYMIDCIGRILFFRCTSL